MGIKYRRLITLHYDTNIPMPTFNEFYNEHLKEFKEGLINGTLDSKEYNRISPNGVLVEQFNIERVTTVYHYFPEPEENIQLESHMF